MLVICDGRNSVIFKIKDIFEGRWCCFIFEAFKMEYKRKNKSNLGNIFPFGLFDGRSFLLKNFKLFHSSVLLYCDSVQLSESIFLPGCH